MAPTGPRDLRRAQRCFRALGDETRLRLVALLRGGEQCVCDLTDALGTGQSRLSFHLKALKAAGIVTDRRQGRWIYYALNPGVGDAVERFAEALRPGRDRI
jgi:ArsR family transcriptional regulator